MHPTAERFQTRLRELGLDAEVRELADSTRTAREAADAVGVATIADGLAAVVGEAAGVAALGLAALGAWPGATGTVRSGRVWAWAV